MGDSDAPLMTSHRPYILRALYEWIADNGMTPHVLVDAGVAGVRVPPHVVKDGRVVLNIAERAGAILMWTPASGDVSTVVTQKIGTLNLDASGTVVLMSSADYVNLAASGSINTVVWERGNPVVNDLSVSSVVVSESRMP